MTSNIYCKTFTPLEPLPKEIILPVQSHSPNIVKIETGLELVTNTDGLWTESKDFLLGVKTADCAPICLWDDEKFGIVHAGWRGTVNGAIENLLQIFTNESGPCKVRTQGLNVWIGPILPRFEIQKNACYQQIHHKFGDRFFSEVFSKVDLGSRSTLIFEFKQCLQFMLPQAKFDPRSTLEDPTLASWRRDKHFENGQNVTVIGPANRF